MEIGAAKKKARTHTVVVGILELPLQDLEADAVVIDGEHVQLCWEGVRVHFAYIKNVQDQFQENNRRPPNPDKEPKKTRTFLPAAMVFVQEPLESEGKAK